MKKIIFGSIILSLAIAINGVWYIHYTKSNERYQYQLNQMNDQTIEQKRVIEYQEFIIDKYKESNILDVTVTAYTPRASETDSTPQFTAIMSKSHPGYTAAVSRDLINYLGRKIYIEGVGVFKLEDVMNRRYRQRIDLMFGSVKAAREFGKKQLKVVVLNQFDQVYENESNTSPEG